MSLQKNGDLSTRQIKGFDQRVQELYQLAQQSSQQPSERVLEYLEEVQSILEELNTVEEELRQQNEQLIEAHRMVEFERKRYHELFEFAPDGYLVTDGFGKIHESNQTAAKLLQVDKPRLLGKVLANFVPEAQRYHFRSMLNRLPSIQRVQEWELQFCGRDGTPFLAAVTVEMVCNDQEPLITLRWLLRDITSRKRAEEELQYIQLHNLQLLEADRMKTQFMATISHELRTPMNVILGFSELLLRRLRRQESGQLTSMVESILNSGKHLLNLIEEILDFSRLQANRLELRLELFDLIDLATTMADEMRPVAEQKSLELRLRLNHPHFLVLNDRVRLRQVLINLLSNAIKFTEVGYVAVEIRELSKERLVIIVSDTGIGIDAVHQTQIFKEFWQVDQSVARSYNGTGLGLSITRALVELMQGTITVESRLGEGSTFRVELPRRVTTVVR